MPRIKIHFFQEGITYTLKQKAKIREWLSKAILSEGKTLDEINFILCSDSYLLEINQQYLNHDTYTDIITFDNSDDELKLKGDIFISIDRIKENAQTSNVSEVDELHRVVIHGTLHLLGYRDKTKKEKELMTEMENKFLSARNF